MRELQITRFSQNTPSRDSVLFYSHRLLPLNQSGVSFISFPLLIISSRIQRGGIPKQPPHKSAYLTSTTSVGMPLMVKLEHRGVGLVRTS